MKDYESIATECLTVTRDKDGRIKIGEAHHKIVNALRETALNARKCEFCGGTDLVCGKGWQEERDKKCKEIANLKRQVEELQAMMTKPQLETINKLHKHLRDKVDTLQSRIRDYEEALEKIEDYCSQGYSEAEKYTGRIAKQALAKSRPEGGKHES